MEQQEFHRSVAADCFNKCWDYIEKEKRTEAENEEMRRLAEVSFWHWIRVEDHTKENESVGYWQLARVYAISGRYKLAYYYAERCIQVSEENALVPFYIGYGYEAKARAYFLGGYLEEARDALGTAYALADTMSDAESKQMLMVDLDQIRSLFPD